MPDKRIFIEQRPNGDFAVLRPNAKRASAVLPTQKAALQRAAKIEPGVKPIVERVRHTTKGKPDQWRSAR